jgi:hypothetical protein
LPRPRIQLVHGTVPQKCASNILPARSGIVYRPALEGLRCHPLPTSSTRAREAAGPLKPGFGLSGDVTRHRLSPTDKLNCPPCKWARRVLATMQQAVRGGGDRVGIDDKKTRKSAGQLCPAVELPHFKPKPGLSGPPACQFLVGGASAPFFLGESFII